VEVWNRKGLCAHALGDYQAAADCFNRGLRSGGRTVRSLTTACPLSHQFLRGLLAVPAALMGRGARQAPAARTALLLCHRGLAMAELGRLEQAERDLSKAAKLERRSWSPRAGAASPLPTSLPTCKRWCHAAQMPQLTETWRRRRRKRKRRAGWGWQQPSSPGCDSCGGSARPQGRRWRRSP
jgi:tetratricopeptide (TPR) repeat protein